MGLLNRLKHTLGGGDAAPASCAVPDGEFAGLNMKQVLDAHLAWRKQLEDMLANRNHDLLDAEQTSRDDRCVLGMWLYSEGKRLFGRLPEYEKLRHTHAEFHECAAKILIEHSIGSQEAGDELLKGRFNRLSRQIQLDVVRLYTAQKR
jgi:hypothetical protein